MGCWVGSFLLNIASKTTLCAFSDKSFNKYHTNLFCNFCWNTHGAHHTIKIGYPTWILLTLGLILTTAELSCIFFPWQTNFKLWHYSKPKHYLPISSSTRSTWCCTITCSCSNIYYSKSWDFVLIFSSPNQKGK